MIIQLSNQQSGMDILYRPSAVPWLRDIRPTLRNAFVRLCLTYIRIAYNFTYIYNEKIPVDVSQQGLSRIYYLASLALGEHCS